MPMSDADKNFIRLVRELIAIESEGFSVEPNEKEKLEADFHEAWLKIDRVGLREYQDPGLAECMRFLIQATKDDPFKINEDCSDWHDWWRDEGLDQWPSHIRRYFELVPPYIRAGSSIPKDENPLFRIKMVFYL